VCTSMFALLRLLSCCLLSFLTIFLPLSLYFFFLHSYPPHRDLHSFPTRRSSDLKLPIASVIFYNRSGTVFTDLLKDYRALRQFRSGEHTSELQSRFDLVCRLLLEKKKKKRKMNRSDTEVVKQTILPQHQVTPLDQ